MIKPDCSTRVSEKVRIENSLDRDVCFAAKFWMERVPHHRRKTSFLRKLPIPSCASWDDDADHVVGLELDDLFGHAGDEPGQVGLAADQG